MPTLALLAAALLLTQAPAHAPEAKTHLQQAFDRRANTLKGDTLPDPTKDDFLLKLKKDKAFWTFVEALPKT